MAEAALSACNSSLARWNQQGDAAAEGAPPVEAPSLITGAPTSPMAARLTLGTGNAFFRKMLEQAQEERQIVSADPLFVQCENEPGLVRLQEIV